MMQCFLGGIKYEIGCGVSGVRLVSTGGKSNTVSVKVDQLDLTDALNPESFSILCV